jgi:hypothetical protein
VVILDIADRGHPRVIANLDYHPPFPGFTHTVVPLFDRNLLVVTDESGEEDGSDWPKRIWLMDVRVEEKPLIISTLPKPRGFEDLFKSDPRIGAHNVHENEPEPGSAILSNSVVSTWFAAGLRIYDISDPFEPHEIGAFIPETPVGQKGVRISDVFVDDRELIYVSDRLNGGLYVLEYTGKERLT